MNKKGWLKIVEVFTTILLIIGVLLIITNRAVYEREDIQKNIYEAEIGILREIQLDNELRGLILALAEESLPVEPDEDTLPEIMNLVLDKKPDYLNCKAKICSASAAECRLDSYENNKDTYAQSVIITVLKTSVNYTPKRLKIFCWIKG